MLWNPRFIPIYVEYIVKDNYYRHMIHFFDLSIYLIIKKPTNRKHKYTEYYKKLFLRSIDNAYGFVSPIYTDYTFIEICGMKYNKKYVKQQLKKLKINIKRKYKIIKFLLNSLKSIDCSNVSFYIQV